MKVLIMDKEQTWRLKLTELAAGWGYLPEAVSSEVEVWSTLEGCTEPVLLVLDQNALQDDQPGLVRKLRKIKEAQHLYVILISEPGTTEVIASGLGDGADDCVLKPVREEELRSRLAVGRRTLKYQYDLAKLSQELTARTRQISQLRTLDGLTGISNRQSFEERLTDEWRRALREGNHISLLMIDIDFFKEYNSTYGHLAGDECLRQVAAVLSASIGRGGDFVARYGGEEFAVLLPNTDKGGYCQDADGTCFVRYSGLCYCQCGYSDGYSRRGYRTGGAAGQRRPGALSGQMFRAEFCQAGVVMYRYDYRNICLTAGCV
jgi:PleD family two-component response regulator